LLENKKKEKKLLRKDSPKWRTKFLIEGSKSSRKTGEKVGKGGPKTEPQEKNSETKLCKIRRIARAHSVTKNKSNWGTESGAATHLWPISKEQLQKGKWRKRTLKKGLQKSIQGRGPTEKGGGTQAQKPNLKERSFM